MRIYAEQVSPDLIDAARVDGAGEFRILPDCLSPTAPGYVTVLLFALSA
jgi:ABC-type glycerol-3-phosphate transport system permease component